MKLYFTLLLNLIFVLSLSAQKRVLIEKFTSAFCGSCPNASLEIQYMQEAYPELIWVNHHKPTWWTDYKLENEQSGVLWNDLSVPGTPRAVVDRTPIGTQLTYSLGNWSNMVNQQLAQPAYANLELSDIAYDLESRTFDFKVNVNFESLPPNGEYRITAMIVEDSVTGTEQHSYFNNSPGHPLEGLGDIIWDYTHRNVTRAILNEPWGTPNSLPAALVVGQTYSYDFTYTVPEAYNPEQIKVVAVVSRHDENNLGNRQVLNVLEVKMNEQGLVLTNAEEIFWQSQQISIHPNPANDYVNLDLSFIPDQVDIFNNNGQLIQRYGELSKQQIDVSQLNTGLYFLRIHLEGYTISRKLAIVR